MTLFRPIFLTLLLAVGPRIVAGESLPSPAWDRTLALETAAQAEIDAEVGHLLELARNGKNEPLLERLSHLANSTDLAVPARELALYRFALGLGDLPPGSVGKEVLDHLAGYQARTLVSHEERADAAVPLFNIRAAAHGVRNAWVRQTAENIATRLLSGSPADWIDAWLNALPEVRKGFLTALDYASDRQLSGIGLEASLRLAANPELTIVAGKSALLAGDLELLEHVTLAGRGPGLASLFRAISEALPAGARLQILRSAIEAAPASSAALAIATMGPRLAADPEGEKLLAGTVTDPTLGPAASLALVNKVEASAPPVPISIQAEDDARISEWVENAPISDNTKIALGYPVPIPVDTHLPFDGFRAYNGLHMRHQDFMNNTPWVHGHELGATHTGRTVWAYRLGDEDLFTIDGLPESAMLTNGGIHAREWQSPEVVTGIMELLVEQQDDDYLYSYLRDNANVIIIPVLNVDGFQQTQRFPSRNWMGTDPDDPEFSPRDGRMRRKNMLTADEDLFTQSDHLNGVDLNRNNPPFWNTDANRSSPDLNSIVHHGASPHSEPETQALVAAAQLGPIEKLSMYTDVHSFSQVHFWVRNDNDRLAFLTQNLLSTFSGHHVAFPAGKNYAFASASSVARNRGIGATDEFFTMTYQVPAWTLEIEPSGGQAFHAPLPGSGADYGGLARNGHDGFILPESEIQRVRTELAQTFAVAYYQQAGPPALAELRVIDQATGAVVFQADWDTTGATTRTLHSFQAQPLQLDRNYRFWGAWDKPMRWRKDGEIDVLPGQLPSRLDVDAGIFVNDVLLTTTVNDLDWLDQSGGAPAGYMNYRDDALFVDFRLLNNANNQDALDGPSSTTLQFQTWDMTGQQTDADPSTVARWENGGWSGYEDSAGMDLTDTGGTDSTISFQVTSETLGDPFVVEAGTSGAWYDPARGGEGFMLEILANNVAVLYWFTYDTEGWQDWYIAVGEIRGNQILFPELLQVSGGEFGPGFNPENVTEKVVGSASFIWSDCDSGEMDWTLRDDDGSVRKGRMNLQRLSRLMGIDCGNQALPPDLDEALLSGSWFDPMHAGEGYTLEVLVDGRVLVYWFSFDAQGNRRWFFGVGEIVDGKFVFDEMLTTRNGLFGPGFDPGAIEEPPWGSLELDIDCDGGIASFTPIEAGFTAGTLSLIRLTALDMLGCDGL